MKRINKARIILLLLFLATFIGNIIGNIRLKNQNKQFLNKSYSIPLETFLFNRATTDKNGNLYVANDMLSVVQKFNNNGQYIIGNLWIHNGKITFLKASIFPIDSSIVICMYILMECFLFVKKKIYKETNNNAGK